MATFVASKFDPETDPDRPEIGSIVEVEDKKWEVKRVEYALMSDIIKSGFKEPDPSPQERVFNRSHIDRPAVTWNVFVDEVKEETEE